MQAPKILFLLLFCVTAQAQAYTYQTKKGITYDSVNGVALKMDVYIPNLPSGQKAPLVLAIHGGCFTSGSKEQMSYIGTSFAPQGFVVATINYRLAPQYLYPAGLTDAQQALRFLRKNAATYKIDPNRIAALGSSAGSTIAALLGLRQSPDRQGKIDSYSARVPAVMDYFGRMDFMHEQNPSNLNSMDCAEKWIGTTRQSNPSAFEMASPMNYVDTNSAEFFIFHGTEDPQVLPLHSQRLHQKLQLNKKASTLFLEEGSGHGLSWTATRFGFTLLKKKFAMPYSIVLGSSQLLIDSGATSTPASGYVSDRYYAGGAPSTYSSVSNAVVKTVRYSSSQFSYNMPVSAGLKKVVMSFVEAQSSSKGYRLMDILFGATRFFENFDLIAMGASRNIPMDKEIYVNTITGQVNLTFKKKNSQGNAAVGAIKVIPVQSYQ